MWLNVLMIVAVLGASGENEAAQRVTALEQENARLAARIVELEQQVIALQQTLAKSRQREEVHAQEKAELSVLAGVVPETDRMTHEAGFISETQSDGMTVLTARGSDLRPTSGTRASHWMQASLHIAPDGSTPNHAELRITAIYSGGIYNRIESATLTAAGGNAVTLAVLDYRSVPKVTGGRSTIRRNDETLVLAVPYAQLEAIGRAHEATLKIGRAEFAMTPQQTASLRALAAQQEMRSSR